MTLAHDLIEGSKTCLVFIHGFCEDRSIWKDFLHYFKDHRILCIDMPGFGESPVKKELDLEHIADEVHKLCLAKKIEKFILIGHSMGGYVSAVYTKKYEADLKGICFFHSHPFADGQETKEARTKVMNFVEKNGSKGYVDSLIPRLFSEENEKRFPKEISVLKVKAYAYGDQAVIEGMRAMRDREDQSKTIENLSIPVMCLLGKKDRATTFDVCQKQAVLPAVGMIHYSNDLGHQGMMEDPDLCAAAIEEFIVFCDSY